MGGSPPPGSKKGGYKPVVRSCVENIKGLHFALLHVRRSDSGARPSLDADGYPTEEGESSLHESAKGKKLVCKNGEEFAGEFGLMRSTGGHSYQYGNYICDYYLKSLGLPEIGGKGLYAA